MNRKLNRLSIVVPVYNEESNISKLYDRLKKVQESLSIQLEIIFVNDGSDDNSLNIMKAFALQDTNMKIIDLSRNFGHQIAIKAGLNFVSGDAAVIMDADLQDPPEIIGAMVK